MIPIDRADVGWCRAVSPRVRKSSLSGGGSSTSAAPGNEAARPAAESDRGPGDPPLAGRSGAGIDPEAPGDPCRRSRVAQREISPVCAASAHSAGGSLGGNRRRCPASVAGTGKAVHREAVETGRPRRAGVAVGSQSHHRLGPQGETAVGSAITAQDVTSRPRALHRQRGTCRRSARRSRKEAGQASFEAPGHGPPHSAPSSTRHLA